MASSVRQNGETAVSGKNFLGAVSQPISKLNLNIKFYFKKILEAKQCHAKGLPSDDDLLGFHLQLKYLGYTNREAGRVLCCSCKTQ